MLGKVNEELVGRGIAKSAELPAGKYTGGKDIPAGSYIITCKTDESHHGIVWVSAAADDLNNQYPSILYEHVSFSSEEKFRVTIEEGGILNALLWSKKSGNTEQLYNSRICKKTTPVIGRRKRR